MVHLSHKFKDSSKMLIINLSVPEILQPEHGIRTISSPMLVRSWSVLPERQFLSTTGQNLLFQRVDFAVLREDTCPAPAWFQAGRRQITADSYTKWQRQRWLPEFSPTSSVNTMAVTVSCQGCPKSSFFCHPPLKKLACLPGDAECQGRRV